MKAQNLPACGCCRNMNSTPMDEFLSPSMRDKIKKIVANIHDSNGQSNCAFEIAYDMLLHNYDHSRATLDDIITFLQSIQHYDTDLQTILELYQNMKKLEINVSDLQWAHDVMIEEGWSHEVICGLWPQIDFELLT